MRCVVARAADGHRLQCRFFASGRAELKLAPHPGIGEDDVEGPAHLLHRRVESVEVASSETEPFTARALGPR